MLSVDDFRASLPIQGLGIPFFYFETVGSTNDIALEKAQQGAAHGTLVLAELQTAGRGRAGRVWYSTAKHALTFSLVLRPLLDRSQEFSGLAGLGALAVVKAFEKWSVRATIKWPNDVLIERRKVAGILAETSWVGDVLEYVVMGIGINVRAESVPVEEKVDYPATCVESAVGRRVDRNKLLIDVLESLGYWYERIGSKALLDAWQDHLAFLNQEVVVHGPTEDRVGALIGLTTDGRLRLETSQGEQVIKASGDVRMRLVDTDPKSAKLGK